MERIRIPLLLFFAVAGSAAATAADLAGGAVPVALSGAYSLSFAVNAGSTLAPGTTILCKAKAVPNAPPLENLRLLAIPAMSGVATLTGSRGTGSSAVCTVQIPFYWVAGNAQSNGQSGTQGGVALSYEIDVVSGPGAVAVPVRRQEGIGVAYPAPGGTASLRFNLVF